MENLSFFTYILENITISNNGLYNLSRSLFTTPNNNFNFQNKKQININLDMDIKSVPKKKKTIILYLYHSMKN